MEERDVNEFFIGVVDEEFLNYTADFYPKHIGVGMHPSEQWLVRVDKVAKSIPKLEEENEVIKQFMKKLNAIVIDEVLHAILGSDYRHKPYIQIYSVPENKLKEVRNEINNYLKEYSNLVLKENFITINTLDDRSYGAIIDLALLLRARYKVKLKLGEERDLSLFYNLTI